MSDMKLIYIAGPFRAPTPLGVRRNVEAARDVGLEVARWGGYPVIPHTMTSEFDKLLTDEFWLNGTMALLERCDAIVLTPDWERSSGARAELARAKALEMPWLVYVDTSVMREDRLRLFLSAVRPRQVVWWTNRPS